MEPLRFEKLEQGEEITIETLARMIAKGCSHNDQRFDAVESRLGRIENLLMEEQKRDLDNLKARVKRLEDAIAL
jgi:hypothetical protein